MPRHMGFGQRDRFAPKPRAILVWSRLHGLVSLEFPGNFTSMGIDPGQLFEAQLPALTA